MQVSSEKLRLCLTLVANAYRRFTATTRVLLSHKTMPPRFRSIEDVDFSTNVPGDFNSSDAEDETLVQESGKAKLYKNTGLNIILAIIKDKDISRKSSKAV